MEESRKKPEKDTERPGEIQREKRITKKEERGMEDERNDNQGYCQKNAG